MKDIKSVFKYLSTKVTFWLFLFIGLLCLSVYLVYVTGSGKSFSPDWRWRQEIMGKKAAKKTHNIIEVKTENNDNNDTEKVLTLAAKYEKPEIVKILLAAGVQISAEEKKRLSGYLSDLEILENIPPLSSFNAEDMGIALLYATAYSDDPKVVKALIAAGADVNAKGKNDITPLMKAVLRNRFEVVKELVYAGADVNAKEKYGVTALMYAARHDHAERRYDMPKIVVFLIDAGADVNAKDENGNTAETYAQGNIEAGMALSSARFEKKKIYDGILDDKDVNYPLLYNSASAQKNLRSFHESKNGSLLYASAHSDYPKLVKTLIAAGAGVNAKDKNGQMALMFAAFYYNHEFAKELIAVGADVNAKDKDGKTPLMYAASHNHATYRSDSDRSEVIKVLIAAGADVNAKDKDGKTPLIYAASNICQDTRAVEDLIFAGADVNAKDKYEKTPLMYAANACSNPDIVNILIAAGAK